MTNYREVKGASQPIKSAIQFHLALDDDDDNHDLTLDRPVQRRNNVAEVRDCIPQLNRDDTKDRIQYLEHICNEVCHTSYRQLAGNDLANRPSLVIATTLRYDLHFEFSRTCTTIGQDLDAFRVL